MLVLRIGVILTVLRNFPTVVSKCNQMAKFEEVYSVQLEKWSTDVRMN